MCRGANRPGPQFLEDLATGYWYSEVLFTAIELKIFTLLGTEGKSVDELAELLDCQPQGLRRFLNALSVLGLLCGDNGKYYNTATADTYLVEGKADYQGDSILWRKYLVSPWQDLAACLKAGGRVDYGSGEEDPAVRKRRIANYITAMDRVARRKVAEILPIFGGIPMRGRILDVGAGSGAVSGGFLKQFPATTATLVDLAEVLEFTGEAMVEEEVRERINYCPANILEPWPVEREQFDLVILSNIVHAYAEEEIADILAKAAACLKPDGYLLIHDFFLEHFPEKAALFDLNMFINTYNGKVFSHKWVCRELARLNLKDTGLIPLKSDTAVIIAGKDETNLTSLKVNPREALISRIKELGFAEVCPLSPETVHVTDWADLRCRYGCSHYGIGHCPPYSPLPEKTRKLLKDYSQALLLKGEPPTRDFQQQVLKAEKLAFKAGFHKAFAFWAGPCSLCADCTVGGNPPDRGTKHAGALNNNGAGNCRNTKEARPSMEGSGIDVFETVRRAGFTLNILKEKGEFVTYFALLLLE